MTEDNDKIAIVMDMLVKEGVMSRVRKGKNWAYVQNELQYKLWESREEELSKKIDEAWNK